MLLAAAGQEVVPVWVARKTYGLRNGDGFLAGHEEIKNLLDKRLKTRRREFAHDCFRW